MALVAAERGNRHRGAKVDLQKPLGDRSVSRSTTMAEDQQLPCSHKVRSHLCRPLTLKFLVELMFRHHHLWTASGVEHTHVGSALGLWHSSAY